MSQSGGRREAPAFMAALEAFRAGDDATAGGHLEGLRTTPDWSAHAALLRAQILGRGEAPAARFAAVEEALGLAPEDASVWLRAARLVGLGSGFGATMAPPKRDLLRALHAAERYVDHALTLAPDDPSVHATRYDLLERLGRPTEALRALDRAIAGRPDDVRGFVRAATVALGRRDAPSAFDYASRGVACDGTHAVLLDLRAESAVQAGMGQAAWPLIARALEATPDAWIAAVDRYVHSGALEAARRVVDEAPDGPDRAAARARFALWRLDLQAALTEAQAALDADPEHPLAWHVLGAVHTLQADADAAVKALDKALRSFTTRRHREPQWLTTDAILTWRSEAHRRAGRFAKARADADQAMTAAREWNLTAQLCRVLAIAEARPRRDDPLDRFLWRPVGQKLASLFDDPSLGEEATAAQALQVGEQILQRFGGNRSAHLTRWDGAALTCWPTPAHPRHEGRKLQLLLRTRPLDAVMEGYRTLQERFPDDPTAFTYQGEVLVWAGRYAEAIAVFEHAIAIDVATVWAYIGLGASQMYLGQHDAAAETWERGVQAANYKGPTLYVYEGELAYRRGDLDGAVRSLDTALRKKPRRVSAWVLRALVEAQRGEPRPARWIAHALRDQSPGLWLDVARSLGVAPGADRHAVPMLGHALSLMRGNRSSTVVSYMVDDQHMRFAAFKPLGPPEALFGSMRSGAGRMPHV